MDFEKGKMSQFSFLYEEKLKNKGQKDKGE